MFKNKILMITGGTGSFGNAVLDRFLKTDVKQIIIFSRDEKKQEDMRIAYNNSKLHFVIGDVRDSLSILNAMKGVDYVFHAAALKQVPSCEFYPMEAVKTNVIGTENVINAAVANNVRKLILLSTDKAVYPINAMGISKSMAEKVLVAKARSLGENETVLCATRYGNVMASRGSVIPLFIDKMLQGEPLTLTDGSMTRFLMSLDESVDLVLHAFSNGKQGDIFVQKASACTISTLSEALGIVFEKEITTKIIGTRHGEKLYETLVSREEVCKAVDEGLFYRVPADNRSLNYDKYILDGQPDLNNIDDYTSHNTTQLNVDEVCDVLRSLDYIKDKLAK